MLTNEYLKRVYEGLEKRNANEPEFLQACLLYTSDAADDANWV